MINQLICKRIVTVAIFACSFSAGAMDQAIKEVKDNALIKVALYNNPLEQTKATSEKRKNLLGNSVLYCLSGTFLHLTASALEENHAPLSQFHTLLFGQPAGKNTHLGCFALSVGAIYCLYLCVDNVYKSAVLSNENVFDDEKKELIKTLKKLAKSHPQETVSQSLNRKLSKLLVSKD